MTDVLEPRETMARYRKRMLLLQDCALVADVIRKNPGLPSRWDIATKSGLSIQRVRKCMRMMNSNLIPGGRFEYANLTPKAGPFAGREVRGWFSMHEARYHDGFSQADRHEERAQHGILLQRAVRLLVMQGYTSSRARAAIVEICERLGVNPDEMSDADSAQAIVDLVLDGKAA